MRLNRFNKKIVALWVLVSLIGSIGLFCHGFSQAALAMTDAPKATVKVPAGAEDCGNVQSHKEKPVSKQDKKTAGLLPCCYQKQEPGQTSQNTQDTSDRRIDYFWQSTSAVQPGQQESFDFLSHDPPMATADRLKTVVRRE